MRLRFRYVCFGCVKLCEVCEGPVYSFPGPHLQATHHCRRQTMPFLGGPAHLPPPPQLCPLGWGDFQKYLALSQLCEVVLGPYIISKFYTLMLLFNPAQGLRKLFTRNGPTFCLQKFFLKAIANF